MLSIDITDNTPTDSQAVEIVERKGTGHPDYIADALGESVSIALCREYTSEFGEVLHHNIDKGLLVAGAVEKDFGGGRIIKPMELYLGDRATFSVGKKAIAVRDIAISTIKEWFGKNLRGIDPERDIVPRIVLRPGSVELTDIFSGEKNVVRGANDTSAAVGCAPFTETEKAVFDIERYLNSTLFKEKYPGTGEDVKVMGLRRNRELELTVAMPLIASSVGSEQEYFEMKAAILDSLRDFGESLPFDKVDFNYNTLDKRGRGVNGAYLTLTGTSAEDADSGQIGRGNRVNGVIALCRPSSTEAAAGKNPTSHVGKIYSVLSQVVANDIYERVEGVREAHVWLLSRIGEPVNEPREAAAQLICEQGADNASIEKQVEEIFNEHLGGIEGFIEALSKGEYAVC